MQNRYSNQNPKNTNRSEQERENQYRGGSNYQNSRDEYNFNQNDRGDRSGGNWSGDSERTYGTPFGDRNDSVHDTHFGYGNQSDFQSNERDNASSLKSRVPGNYRDISENHGNRGFYESSNQDRGMHSGKGPKGYRRSDERIHEEVCDALTMDPHVDASDIESKSENGVVTLEGTVEDRAMKRRAEECAERCRGVQDIQNNLKVKNANLWEKMTGQEAKDGKDSRDGTITKKSATGNLQ